MVTFADLFEGDGPTTSSSEGDGPTSSSVVVAPPAPSDESSCVASEHLSLDDGFGVVRMRGLPSGGEAKTPCEAKNDCRRRGSDCAAFVWSAATSVALSREELRAALRKAVPDTEGLLLYLSLSDDSDSLRRALRSFEEQPAFQTRSSASIVGDAARWPPQGGPPTAWNNTLSHGFISEEKHKVVRYKLSLISHEVWVHESSQKIMETYDGLCHAKSKCASMNKCDGFVLRARDGTALHYANLRLRPAGDRRRTLGRFASKFRRVTWLYQRDRGPEEVVAKFCVGDKVEPLLEAERLYEERRADLVPDPDWPASTVGERRLVISLTTLPGRIEQIRPVLESLLAQSMLASEIVVSVPKKESRLGMTQIPKWLETMSAVRVLRPEQDYGPATKLIPALQEILKRAEACADEVCRKRELETMIVVVDDDTLYPPRLVESLVSWSNLMPDAAVATTGWPVAVDSRYPHWTMNYLVYGNELYAPHRVSIIRGNCGFLVRPKFFDSRLWTDMPGAPRGATLMDDVWISGHLARRKVPRVVVPLDSEQTTKTPEFKDVVTLDSALGTGITDRQSANEQAIRHFTKTQKWDVLWKPPKPFISVADNQGKHHWPSPNR